MNRIIVVVSVALFALFAGSASATAATFGDLLRRIPDSANALVFLDVQHIFASDIAKAENWRETYADNYAASPLIVHPSAKQFVLGAELDIETMQPHWEAASMELSVNRSAKSIADRVGGIVDSISGTDVVWPKKGFCVAEFSSTHFGVLSPANRQSAARWIDQGGDASRNLSAYLLQATRYADDDSAPEILMAIDLRHLLRPEEIRAAVKGSDLLKSTDTDAVTSLLAGMRGVTLGVRVDDDIRGKLIVDFGEDAQIIADVAKPLILKVLASAGAMIDEFEQWEPSVQGKRAAIEGTLSPDSMRRLFSLIALDAAIIQRPKQKDLAAADPPSNTAVGLASLRYFRAVTKFVRDIQRPRRTKQDFSQIALWVNNYARKIEKIPTKNVDSDLVAYADKVAYHMRDAVANIHGTAEEAAERASSVRRTDRVRVGAMPTWRTVNYGGYRMRAYAPMAYADVDIGAAQERKSIEDDARKQGAEIARQNLELIAEETDAIRAEMTKRYGIKF